MEKTMKTHHLATTTLLTLLLCTIPNSDANAEELKLYSHEGYPYKRLIARSDSVKIIYSENASDHTITCRVEIDRKQEITATTALQVSKEDFSQKPLASCLTRDEAKRLLSKSFS